MASQYVLIVLVSCLLLLQNTLAIPRSSPLPGGWKPIEDVNSSKVKEIGEFAVTEHNKEAKLDLQFDAVKKAIPRSSPLPGGWKPIEDVNSSKVKEIGEFAVTEHNKEAKLDLQFDAVKKGEFQFVLGTNYRLVISAKDHGIASDYNVEVSELPLPTKPKKLNSFTKA
ncbi:hypothetical protein NE237_002790 [Protea cynaroides]|uniref:Cystatin domain-containing protein n=1 Tax=Protea cynaroides TaxID=273540 RepID=A0A9Q0KG55_9MAGN|nr:hypothetical protein NE237_002790 [Protea cynaroides]